MRPDDDGQAPAEQTTGGQAEEGQTGSEVGVVPSFVFAAGSPVRIGPAATAVGALLTCAHYLPIGHAAALFKALTGLAVSTGYLAGARHHAADLLATTFLM